MTIWIPTEEPEKEIPEKNIYNREYNPASADVLYYYDGPMLFLSNWGTETMLVVFSDEEETEDGNVKAALTGVIVTNEDVDKVRNDKITLYEVFLKEPRYYIVMDIVRRQIDKVWKNVNIPDRYIPIPNIRLHRGIDDVPIISSSEG